MLGLQCTRVCTSVCMIMHALDWLRRFGVSYTLKDLTTLYRIYWSPFIIVRNFPLQAIAFYYQNTKNERLRYKQNTAATHIGNGNQKVLRWEILAISAAHQIWLEMSQLRILHKPAAPVQKSGQVHKRRMLKIRHLQHVSLHTTECRANKSWNGNDQRNRSAKGSHASHVHQWPETPSNRGQWTHLPN